MYACRFMEVYKIGFVIKKLLILRIDEVFRLSNLFLHLVTIQIKTNKSYFKF